VVFWIAVFLAAVAVTVFIVLVGKGQDLTGLIQVAR
jgi:hypothetical protein